MCGWTTSKQLVRAARKLQHTNDAAAGACSKPALAACAGRKHLAQVVREAVVVVNDHHGSPAVRAGCAPARQPQQLPVLAPPPVSACSRDQFSALTAARVCDSESEGSGRRAACLSAATPTGPCPAGARSLRGGASLADCLVRALQTCTARDWALPWCATPCRHT